MTIARHHHPLVLQYLYRVRALSPAENCSPRSRLGLRDHDGYRRAHRIFVHVHGRVPFGMHDRPHSGNAHVLRAGDRVHRLGGRGGRRRQHRGVFAGHPRLPVGHRNSHARFGRGRQSDRGERSSVVRRRRHLWRYHHRVGIGLGPWLLRHAAGARALHERAPFE